MSQLTALPIEAWKPVITTLIEEPLCSVPSTYRITIMRSTLALLFILAATTTAFAQSESAVWSLALNVGYVIPVADGMRGTSTEFRGDVSQDYSPRRYPYADDRAVSFSAGGLVAYRPGGSPISAIGGLQRTTFFVDDEIGNEARMALWTMMLGAEYSLGTFEDGLNPFARAGVNGSIIDGNVVYRYLPPFGFTTEITPAVRIGIESELGLRANLQTIPISVEASLHYTHANLFGRSFEDPGKRPPQALEEVALNDGANPDDAGDASRAIGFLSVRATARVRF